MNILLLNDNPVVTKLVTLSAQKTSDELDIVDNTQEIQEKNYDLFVLDDSLYSEDTLREVKSKIKFKKSLYICSRDAKKIDGFTTIIKKPFLPTDLVELFAKIGKEASVVDLDAPEENFDSIDKGEETLNLDELEELDLDNEDILDLEEFDNDNVLDELDLDNEVENLSDIDLDLELEADSELDEPEDLVDSVLDKEEVQEVQDLLEEAEEVDEIIENLDLDDDSLDELEELDNEEELELDEELELEEEELELDEELELEEEDNLDEELNLESQIESAVLELSDTDLDSEIETDTLLDMTVSDVDGLDALNARDIKMAIGEEVGPESVEELDVDNELIEEEILEKEVEEVNTESISDKEGVEALKNLLKALTNEDVAASLKGMKININITLGDK